MEMLSRHVESRQVLQQNVIHCQVKANSHEYDHILEALEGDINPLNIMCCAPATVAANNTMKYLSQNNKLEICCH